MNNLKNIFNNWIDNKLENQLSIIDIICKETDIDVKKWFDKFTISDIGWYSGSDFLNSMLEHFSVYLKTEFESTLVKYIEPEGYNINKEPYYGVFINISDVSENSSVEFEMYVDDEDKESFEKIVKKLTLSEKDELMKNKLFSYVINKTNLQFFSNNDIRALKLKGLNECL